jgi:hypothetical protein
MKASLNPDWYEAQKMRAGESNKQAASSSITQNSEKNNAIIFYLFTLPKRNFYILVNRRQNIYRV